MQGFLENRWNLLKLLIIIGILAALGLGHKINISAQEAQLVDFEVGVRVGEYTQTIEWYVEDSENGKEYFLFLPYFSKQKDIEVSFEGPEEIILNDVKLQNGDFANVLKEGMNTIKYDEKEMSMHVLYGSDIPIIHIKTESGNIEVILDDKDNKEAGEFAALADNEILYLTKLEYLKGRGNSTWSFEKKPFNIKFAEKINLFDMGAAKKWCLLANVLDETKLKNKLISDYSDEVGIQYSSKSVVVDLYVNEQYMGNYTLMENVEVGEQRVDITDLEKLNEKANPNMNIEEVVLDGVQGMNGYLMAGEYKWAELLDTPEIITGGYLLEFEFATRYDSAASGFVSEFGQPVIVKSPEYASKEQVEYIRNYYQEFENAVLSGDGYNEQGRHFSDYIDVESVAKMYILQEYIKNLDAGLASCYFFKDVGGKLVAAPGWDFDSAFGRKFKRNEVKMHDPTGVWVTGGKLIDELSDKETIFTLLCRHNEFREEAKKQWINCFEPKVEKLLHEFDMLWEKSADSIVVDCFRWNRNGDSYKSLKERVELQKNNTKEFIIQRAIFMSEIFSQNSCVLGYNSNGGTGSMYDLNFYEKGSVVQLKENTIENGEREFLGWNTKLSGWGEAYQNGDSVILENDTTLYAQWGNPSFLEKIQKNILGILGK